MVHWEKTECSLYGAEQNTTNSMGDRGLREPLMATVCAVIAWGMIMAVVVCNT